MKDGIFMLKKILIIITLIILAGITNTASGYDSDKPIRVGLSDTTFSKYVFDDEEFYSDGLLELTDLATGETVKALSVGIRVTMQDGLFTVYIDKKPKMGKIRGPLILKAEPNNLIGITNHKRAGKPAFYRGIIELVKTAKKTNGYVIVNVLDLKNYLKGVVPNEMPVYFGLEALKAQCIAARNYALRPRDKFYSEFDICDSVACQVYFGAKTEKELSNLAVDETDGLVALYDGQLILAVYSSTAGGYTESYANAFSDPGSKKFPSHDVPYLQAQPDIPNMKSLHKEEDARDFYTTNPETYDNDSSYFRWTRTWTVGEFVQMLNKTMQEQAAFVKPAFTDKDKFEHLHEIKIRQRGISGKVMFIEITTEKGTYTIGKELTIRRLFKKDVKALPSANFVCDLVKDEKAKETYVKFSGGGFGHGVGMSQFGAGKMGKSGMNFINILQHYYTGISIGTVPFTITSEQGKNQTTQRFMAPFGQAQLVINNLSGVSEITLIVNEKETDIEIGRLLKKSKIDISKYMQKGMNTVEIVIPADYTGQKVLNAYIEIKGADNAK